MTALLATGYPSPTTYTNAMGGTSTLDAFDVPAYVEIVCGLDVSPRRIGWAIMTREEPRLLSSGTEHVSATDDLRARRIAWQCIRNEIACVSRREHAQIVAIGIEDAYVGAFKRTAILGALSIGNVEAFAIASYSWILVHRFQPAEWRSAIGISTRGKTAPLEHAQTFKPGLSDQDEADAIGITLALALRLADGY